MIYKKEGFRRELSGVGVLREARRLEKEGWVRDDGPPISSLEVVSKPPLDPNENKGAWEKREAAKRPPQPAPRRIEPTVSRVKRRKPEKEVTKDGPGDSSDHAGN